MRAISITLLLRAISSITIYIHRRVSIYLIKGRETFLRQALAFTAVFPYMFLQKTYDLELVILKRGQIWLC